MSLQTQVAAKIKRLWNEKGYTQPQMADLLHIDKSVCSVWRPAKLFRGQNIWKSYL
jgi:predicted XRE-type DNA-binding protein